MKAAPNRPDPQPKSSNCGRDTEAHPRTARRIADDAPSGSARSWSKLGAKAS
jgi:hypothetical protein